MKPETDKRVGRWDHQCPRCKAFVGWALTYCFDCGVQRGVNPAWK